MAEDTKIWNHANLGGRPRKFKSAAELAQKAVDYFSWADANPIVTSRFMTKQGMVVNTTPRPYTIHGFCVFAGIGDWSSFKKSYMEKKGFCGLIQNIENTIVSNQLDGGMVGIYSPNLTARLNGISDKVQQEVDNKVESRMSREEALKIMEGEK